MTFPVYFQFGAVRLHPHTVFEVLAYAVGFRLYLARRRRLGDVVDARTRWSIVAAAILGAGLGSRLLFWFENPAWTAAHWQDPGYLFSGKTIVGALVGGLAAVELIKRVLGVRHRTGDLFAVPIAMGIAIGRVGCFLTGLDDQTFGTASTLPWAVDFGDGIPRHPVQLYESAFALLLAVWLTRLERAPHQAGSVFRTFMLAYMAWRFTIDWLKPEVRLVAGLSTLQLVALVMVGYYVLGYRRYLRRSYADGGAG